MRVGTCEEIEGLIEREALGWSEIDQQRVEQHLTDCETCASALALARFVRDALQEAAQELPANVSGGGAAPARKQDKSGAAREAGKRWLGLMLAGLFIAAAVVTLLFTLTAAKPKSQRLPTHAPVAETAARPERGPAAQTALTLPADESGWIETTKAGEERTFAQTRVRLAPGTRVRFAAGDATLHLTRGRVDVLLNVDGNASLAQSFFVQTPRFRVEANGARFSVTPESVNVTHERVQVLTLDGRVLAAELAAGAQLSIDESLR